MMAVVKCKIIKMYEHSLLRYIQIDFFVMVPTIRIEIHKFIAEL